MFYSRREAAWAFALFVILLVAGNLFVRATCIDLWQQDCPLGWPVSLFLPRVPEWWQFALFLVLAFGFLAWVQWLDRQSYPLRWVMLTGVVLLLGSNALEGWYYGFEQPMTHGEKRYYHEALRVEDPLEFVRDFTRNQPNLLEHTQTHPPGAVLLLLALQRIIANPGGISLVIGVSSLLLALKWVHRYFLEFFDPASSAYGVLLFALLPAVQIYFLASLEAVITVAMLAAVVAFSSSASARIYLLWSALAVFLASALTFGAVFLGPVLAGFEWLRWRSIRRSLLVFVAVAALWLVVGLFSGFNYIESFLIASRIENPDGFRLFANPIEYIFSRVEGLVEVWVFFGPFLTLLVVKGWRRLRTATPDGFLLLALMWATFAAMLISGAFRTGETARLMLVLLPWMLLPVLVSAKDVTAHSRQSLLIVVCFQTLFMQLLAHFIY